jgi:dCTP deaminase
MILSAQQIKQAVQEGKIGIDLFNEANIKDASYTFTLDSKIHSIEEYQTLRANIKPRYVESTIPDEGYLLEPGQFILGFTKEKLTLNGKYACLLSARGSCAQIGLNILLGSHFAEPDTDRKQTLEISNVAKSPIILFRDMSIVKGIFMPVDE